MVVPVGSFRVPRPEGTEEVERMKEYMTKLGNNKRKREVTK
jgi:hypothetical protein